MKVIFITLVNSLECVLGGPFTRYTPNEMNDDNKKCALDLVFVSGNLAQYIESLQIDRELKWTPCREINKTELQYSDHYALICTFKDIPLK